VFALVLAADSVFGVLASSRRAARLGQAPATSWRQALLDQGFVVGAKALCFAVAFGLWFYSPARLQAEAGLLIVVATGISLVLALGALPALLLLLEEAMARHSPEGFPTLSDEATRFRARIRAATGR
jgi:predicted RND superfamily exporter protein